MLDICYIFYSDLNLKRFIATVLSNFSSRPKVTSNVSSELVLCYFDIWTLHRSWLSHSEMTYNIKGDSLFQVSKSPNNKIFNFPKNIKTNLKLIHSVISNYWLQLIPKINKNNMKPIFSWAYIYIIFQYSLSVCKQTWQTGHISISQPNEVRSIHQTLKQWCW